MEALPGSGRGWGGGRTSREARRGAGNTFFLAALPPFPGGLPRALFVLHAGTPLAPLAGWTLLHSGLARKPSTVPGAWLVPDQYLSSECMNKRRLTWLKLLGANFPAA